MKRTVCFGENYREVEQGISLGCPLSPLMAALFLKPLDDAMAENDLFHIRFMDDWVVVAPTRWKLRRAVKKVNQVLASLNLEKHPDKTFIGRAVRGFTFLGYFLTPWAVSVARKTVDRMLLRVARLYEQGAGKTGIGRYLKRWVGWAKSANILGLVDIHTVHDIVDFRGGVWDFKLSGIGAFFDTLPSYAG